MSSPSAEHSDERRHHTMMQRASSLSRELWDTALGRLSEDEAKRIEERWETWLVWPVLVAALVSVPAVFLTLLDEPFEMIGHIGLWATSVVLIVETVVFFLVSPKKVEWLRRNWWLVVLTILVIIAVIFSIGPMQILRLLRSVGALRVLRAKQVAKAGHSLQKASSSRWWRRLGTLLATVVVATFVVVALIDPESPARSFLDNLVGEEWAIATAIGAGLVLMGTTYFLIRPSGDEDEEDDEDSDEDPDTDEDPARGGDRGEDQSGDSGKDSDPGHQSTDADSTS